MTTEERLDKMERALATVRNRNKWLWLGLILVGGGILISGARNIQEDVISSRRFHVVDDEGNIRTILGVLPEGGASLVLSDEKGNPRVELEVSDLLGPSLSLYDERENPRVMLGVDDELGPELALHGEKPKARVLLGVLKGKPSVEMSDENGKVTWSAP